MNLIADKDGVKTIIGEGDVVTDLDFNYGRKKIDEIEQRGRSWNVNLYDKKNAVGQATFRAYQFFADGIERRTIALVYVGIEPRFRHRGLSYSIAEYVVNTVTSECDIVWGPVAGKPVIFIEKRDLKGIPNQKTTMNFMRKISERALSIDRHVQSMVDHDITLTIVGEDISIQLIEGHLLRSSPA